MDLDLGLRGNYAPIDLGDLVRLSLPVHDLSRVALRELPGAEYIVLGLGVELGQRALS